MFPEHATVDGLELEPFTTENVDVLTLYQYLSDKRPHAQEEFQFLNNVPDETPKETHNRLVEFTEAFEQRELAMYAVRPTEGERTGELAGAVNLEIDWDRRMGDLGAWFRKPFWRRGYAGSVSDFLLELAFDRLDLDLVVVWCLDGNERARATVEAYADVYGGQYDGIRRNWELQDGDPRDRHDYTITQEQWAEYCEDVEPEPVVPRA